MLRVHSIVMTNALTATSAERQHQTTSLAMKTKAIPLCLNNQRMTKNESYVWKHWKDAQ